MAGFSFLALIAVHLFQARAQIQLQGDMERYIFIASSLRRGDWSSAINYHYPPFFPAAVAAVSLVAGDLERAAYAVCLLATAFTIVPLYLMALALFGRRAALLAAAIFAWRFLEALSQPLPEELMTLILYCALLLGLYSLERGRAGWAFITGALFGLAFLTKPEASAYFFTYVSITFFMAVRALWRERRMSSLHTSAGVGPGALTAVTALVAAGYFLATGPYLYAHYRDTGEFSLNPKAKTLFHIHNFLYRESKLYQIEEDEEGEFTRAQRVYMEGDKKPPPASIGSLLRENWAEFVSTYPERFAYSLKTELVPYYLAPIAPAIWPALLLLGLWPSRGLRFRGRELFLHSFILVHVLAVPVFSASFHRFYFTLIPWIMIVMGHALDRGISAVAEQAGKRAERLERGLVMGLVLMMAAVAGAQIAAVRPDQDEIARFDFQRKAATVLKDKLPRGCRFMAELENYSLWYLAGLPPATQEITPANPMDQVIAFAVAKNVKFIVFHKSRNVIRYGALLPLLDPKFSHPLLRRVFMSAAPGNDAYVIYEVLPVSCGKGEEKSGP